jgi:hypothetical protein
MKRITFLVALLLLVGVPVYGSVNVNIYGGFTGSGGGAPYSNFVGSFTASDVAFGGDSGTNWHPFGLGSFGADITGVLDVSASDLFSFGLFSDDGSLLFIDGSLVVDNGGGHAPYLVSNSVSLSQGLHNFEIQFFEDFGGESCVYLHLPEGVAYACDTPEPATIVIWSLLGAFGMIYGWRKRKA